MFARWLYRAAEGENYDKFCAIWVNNTKNFHPAVNQVMAIPVFGSKAKAQAMKAVRSAYNLAAKCSDQRSNLVMFREFEKTFDLDLTYDGQLLEGALSEEERRGGSRQGLKIKIFVRYHDDWVTVADDLLPDAVLSMNNWFIQGGMMSMEVLNALWKQGPGAIANAIQAADQAAADERAAAAALVAQAANAAPMGGGAPGQVPANNVAARPAARALTQAINPPAAPGNNNMVAASLARAPTAPVLGGQVQASIAVASLVPRALVDSETDSSSEGEGNDSSDGEGVGAASAAIVGSNNNRAIAIGSGNLKVGDDSDGEEEKEGEAMVE